MIAQQSALLVPRNDTCPLQAFVTEEKKEHKYANLVIEYARGASPTLILKDGEGEEVESLSIDKWDTDTIREYLTEHLQA